MSEGKYRDSLFARLVLKEKLLPKDQVETLLREVKVRQKKGETVTLSKLLVKRGLITDENYRELSRFLEKEIVICPQCRAPYDAQKYAEGKEFTCKKCGSPIIIQKSFSDTFKTTMKFGALPADISEDEFSELTQEPAGDMYSAATMVETSNPAPQENIQENIQESVPGNQEYAGPGDTQDESEAAYEELVQEKTAFGGSSSSASFGNSNANSTPTPSMERGEYPVALPKLASFQYYRKMNLKKVYPLTISFSPSESKGVVRVRAQVPGAIAIPDYQDIVISHPEPKADFWVLPLTRQKTAPIQVQVWHNTSLATCYLPVKMLGRGAMKFFGFLLLVLGALTGYVFMSYGSLEEFTASELTQYDWFQEGIKQVSLKGPEAVLYGLAGLGGFFLLLTLIFWLVSKPSKSELNQGLKYDD